MHWNSAFHSFHWEISFYCDEFSFMCIFIFFSLATFNILSLFYIFSVLTMACKGIFFSSLACFVFCVPLGSVCVCFFFLNLGWFSFMILLKLWSLSLIWNSSHSSVPVIWKFDLLSCISFIFLPAFFFFLSLSYSLFLWSTYSACLSGLLLDAFYLQYFFEF